MLNQISSHIQVSDESISTKILEKKEKEYSYFELAVDIRDAIDDSTSFTARFWDKKEGEARVYVYQETSKKRKYCGYIQVSFNGIEPHLTAQAGTIENLYSHLKDLVISQPKEQKEFEIFYCHTLNGSGEWRVESEDSYYSYFVQSLLGNINSLEKSAEKVLKSQGVSCAMSFKISEEDLQRHQKDISSITSLAGA
jgi:hypothetical protein